MDAVDIVQKAFSAFVPSPSTSNIPPESSCKDNSDAASKLNPVAQQTPVAVPQDDSLIATLARVASAPAIRDWFKLILLGAVLEMLRRTYMHVTQFVAEHFWISASFDEEDESYSWIMFWLSQQPSWRTARTVEVSGRQLAAYVVRGSHDYQEQSSREPAYLPSLTKTYTLWYNGYYMQVSREERQSGMWKARETLRLNILCRSRAVLDKIVEDALAAYNESKKNTIGIYVSESMGDGWRCSGSRPKRPLSSIILDPGTKDLLIDDARDFLSNQAWYERRGIPFRRGYLLHGAPGSGKTSVIQAIAGELNLDVYIVSLSRSGMDDAALQKLFFGLPERCIALMEDIDAAFTARRGVTRDNSDDDDTTDKGEGNASGEMKDEKKEDRNAKDGTNETGTRVTLSGLLNALDGVGAQEGRILFATTNTYAKLDPALCRPGRMDLHIEFKLASKYQAEELFKCFYLPSDDDEDKKQSKDLKTAPVESEKSLASEVQPEPSSSQPPSIPSSASISTLSSENTTPSVSTSPLPSLDSAANHSTRSPRLTQDQVLSLAKQFADAIPNRQCSMASLQCYLLMYKTRPVTAVEDAPAWVEQERIKLTKKRGEKTT
ncbi:P-loop containing nucleoside triphosphate hydrolase protein [Cristinia sonorae]|uniref:P-loop containing nucleoside triphosphate hydrolase protein n=1 Tax=Cristinia sonorae TaxID=1940300 RepID=A0A8K0XKF0_9AGAR|nr:P-loop containing nucleoside triphosphate hydrolase protein [Cristinia sonorae]